MSLSGLRDTPRPSSGTRNAVTPRAPPPLVRAKTTAAWATMPRLIPDFSPVITYASASRSARQARFAASEPTPGSVRASATIVSPRAVAGSHRVLIASVAFRPRISPARPASWIPYVQPKSPRAISSMAMPKVRRSASWPP